MKIFVISDTHGSNKGIIDYISKLENPDIILYLGDYVEDGEKISEELGVETIIVRGNGDYFSKYKDDELIEVNQKKIFLTHGHQYKVKYNLDRIIYKGEEVGADIILFGHTHIPINTKENGIYIMNPGSPAFPRGRSFEKTFGIIHINNSISMEIINIEDK